MQVCVRRVGGNRRQLPLLGGKELHNVSWHEIVTEVT